MKNRLELSIILVLFICMIWRCIAVENNKENINVLERETVNEVSVEKQKREMENIENKEVSAKSDEKILENQVQQYLSQLTLEEKIAQLFVVLPEAIIDDVESVTAAGTATQSAINKIPVGGFIYFDKNLNSQNQVKTMLENVQIYSMERINLPMFLCVDEEGGTVARIGNSGKFDVSQIEDMSIIGERKSRDEAYEVGKIIGNYLSELGVNVDFAPVADVLSNKDNQVVKKRSFGNDPELVSKMAAAVANGLENQNVYAVYKHFPGHGSTLTDTHEGYAFTNKSLEEIKLCELVPFQDAINNDIHFIMVGHISLPNIIGDDTPASMSSVIITDLLRNEMHYDGIVITDALNMGAIVQQYTSADAAIQTLLAGSDIILMPEDFNAAYQGVIDAVNDGTITIERIDESVERILKAKLGMVN